MRNLSRGAWVLFAALGLLLVVGLAIAAIQTTPTPPPVAPTAPGTPTPPFPSGEPGFDEERPLTVTAVSAGHPVSIDASGTRQIAYTVDDASMVAAHLDCRGCTGMVVFGDAARSDPLLIEAAPVEAEHLLNTGDDRRTLLLVRASGAWTLTLTSTADLPAALPQTGTGPKVVALVGPGSGLSVKSIVPFVGPGLPVHVRAYDAASRTLVGETTVEPGRTARLRIALPVVLEVATEGPWSLTAP